LDAGRDGPVVVLEPPWERRCIEAPSVIDRNGRPWMFYAGGYNDEPQQIGLASATTAWRGDA